MEKTRCNICGGSEFGKFMTMRVAGMDQDYKASAFKSNGETLVKCSNCGLVFISPLPKPPKSILDEYACAIDEEYVSQMKWRIKTFEGSIRKIERIVNIYGNAGRILDVGAAAGAFVKAANDRGWHAYGIEPCKFLVKWGKENLKLGRFLRVGTIEDVDNGEFDVITLWDVIEHTTDPNKTIEDVGKRLSKRGYVVLNIPDISAMIPVLMGKRWPFYESAHLYYFTPDTLDRLMLKHGLHRIHKSRYYQGLSLGYLSYRINQFSQAASKLMVSIVNALGLAEVPVKYWIGQTLLVYRYEGRGMNNAKKV